VELLDDYPRQKAVIDRYVTKIISPTMYVVRSHLDGSVDLMSQEALF
jgi:hypothetical protein